MDAGTSTLNHSFNASQSNLPPGTQGSSSSGPFPEEPPQQQQQHHHKPFFYIQPSQPFLPVQGVQWPLPLALPLNYSPYYGGYPGYGFGMPVMPHYQPSPYLETPGFVMPHTQHHLMDYRRMLNPQYYQSMAYHSRRLRYQHNVPSRTVTSSEVQTEPLTNTQRTSTPSLNNDNSETSNDVSNLSTASTSQKDERSLALKDLATSSSNTTPQKGSFVIETEEVRIECCTTPAGLQVLHARETSDMSHNFAPDVVHCSSLVQGGLLPEDDLKVLNSSIKSEQSQQECPEILLVGTPNVNENMPALETTPTNHPRAKMAANVEALFNEKDLKVVRLPFDAKYLDKLRKMESTVWSTEDTLVQSPELLIESGNETLHGEVLSPEMLINHEERAQEELVPVVEMPMMEEELLAVVPNLETQVDDLKCDVPKQSGLKGNMATEHSPNVLLSDDSPLHRSMQDQQDTSFESLPAYLPSSSWLADFESMHYSKMPRAPQKLNKPMENRDLDLQTRRRKLDAEFNEAAAIRKPKERYKPKHGKVDRRSLSDHECCISRSYNENAFVPYAMKGRRLCTRCSSKQMEYNTSTSPGMERRVLKRKVAPFQPWNNSILPTCKACKGHVEKQFTRKGSSPDLRQEIEGDSLLEKGSCRKWRLMEEMRKELKRPLAAKQNLEKQCPPTVCPKLRERNSPCNGNHQTQWHRIYHCPHGNAIRETDENCDALVITENWRNMDQMYLTHRWPTEKPWKTVPGHNTQALKNDFRAQHLNMHKKSLPLPQGVLRKDTRC